MDRTGESGQRAGGRRERDGEDAANVVGIGYDVEDGSREEQMLTNNTKDAKQERRREGRMNQEEQDGGGEGRDGRGEEIVFVAHDGLLRRSFFDSVFLETGREEGREETSSEGPSAAD